MWVLRANKLTIGELLRMHTHAAPSHTSSARDLPLKESHSLVCDKWSICSFSAGYGSPCLRFLRYDSFQGKRDDLWRNTRRLVEEKDAFRPLVVNTRRNTFFFSAVPVKFSLFAAQRCNSVPSLSLLGLLPMQPQKRNFFFTPCPPLSGISFCPTFCVFSSLPVEEITLQQIKH